MSLRAVFFDMGGTIEKYWYTPELRLKAIPDLKERLQPVGIDLGLSDKELLKIISKGYRRYHKWSIDSMEELPPNRVWAEFIFTGYPIDPQKLAAVAEELMFTLESRFYQREMRSEVPSVLKAIRELGLKIGLISNICCRDLVPANLETYGIRQYFNPIILSSEYGRRKPDPAIFHYAARLANMPTGGCAYVGDRIARDIVGARKAGFRLAVQIINDFDHGEKDEGAEPDAVINDMMELLDILKVELGMSRPAGERQYQVRALLFDAGDILYYRPNRGKNLRFFLKERGIADKAIPAATRNALKRQAYHGLITQNQYRELILRLYGLTDPVQIEFGKYSMDEDDNDILFFKGVPETLKKLKENGYMLGIITDTAMPTYVKLSWFAQGGFGHVWDSIISSKDLGLQKPDPKMYQAALQQLGLTVDQAVFVGHNPEELDGARALGMKTIAFNYEKSTQADYYIEKFEDLLNVKTLSVEDQSV
jgi:HAD superfamily hydrolase (TIGR01549 family)